MKPGLLLPRDVAERWGCSEKHVRNLIRKGALPCFRAGGKLVRLWERDVEAFECRTTQSAGSEDGSASSTGETESVTDASLAMTRAKLDSLRHRFTRS